MRNVLHGLIYDTDLSALIGDTGVKWEQTYAIDGIRLDYKFQKKLYKTEGGRFFVINIYHPSDLNFIEKLLRLEPEPTRTQFIIISDDRAREIICENGWSFESTELTPPVSA